MQSYFCSDWIGLLMFRTPGSRSPRKTQFVIKQTIYIITAFGTYTFVPSRNLYSAMVECVGAGGGGAGGANTAASAASSGNGGGGGGYARRMLTAAQIGSSKIVIVGTGGTGGAAGANPGPDGNTSSFGGPLVVGGGGSGGPAPAIGLGGQPGIGSVSTPAQDGDLILQGGFGGSGINQGTTVRIISGTGGTSFFSLGTGSRNYSANSTGNQGVFYGGGGEGGISWNAGGASAGGDGASGIVIVTEYINQ